MVEEMKVAAELIDRVMDKIENFYFNEDKDGGEALFNQFAESKHSIFSDNIDVEGQEHKVE